MGNWRGWLWVAAAVAIAVGSGACRPSRESISAGQIGCAPGEIQISDEDTSQGWGQSTQTWVAECNGRHFICSELDSHSSAMAGNGATATATSASVSCHEQLAEGDAKPAVTAPAPAAAPPAVPQAPAPTAGAGFLLGATPEVEQHACEAAGNTWQSAEKERATCSGAAADLGFPADTALRFCGQKACLITVRYRPDSEWTNSFAELKGKLSAKYGGPQESDAVIPVGCRSEAEFVDCLQRGVRLHFAWAWPTGERVLLSVGKAGSGDEVAIRIDYTKPARKIEANASAL